MCPGGFSDVWKGQHNDKEVAIKVLRVYTTSDVGRIRKVGVLDLLYNARTDHIPDRGSARRL